MGQILGARELASSGLPLRGLIHLWVTWVVWGSTYLAIRITVSPGAGFGPFWLGASRTLLAGAVLLMVARLRGIRLRLSGRELIVLTATGILMWVGGNGGVNWAEQRVDSGLAALIVGSMPLWIAAMESVIDRRPPTLLLSSSLVAGFVGIVVLTQPMRAQGAESDLIGVLVILAGTVCWGSASLYLSRNSLQLDPLALSGYQQILGGIGFTVLALSLGEALPQPTATAWVAWSYLVLFGSLLAFTSYVQVLRLLPTSIAMTYTYVNPVIAVLLGWAILSEPVTRHTFGGMALVLFGVYGVFQERAGRNDE
ncbi:MAG: EamA family transporter [bacterium]|nr:EamA family transporter [bacterium]